jgi:outer membrane biosynthesis protein TonB
LLRTLDRYIDQPKTTDAFASPWSRLGRDRRFTLLFSISVIIHLVFYAALIKLDSWAILRAMQKGQQPSQLVTFIEIAPPPDHIPLRTAPEPLERADINRLQFDPANADDLHLIQRSPKPTEQRGNNGRLPSADVIERRFRAARGGGDRTGQAPPSNQNIPATASIQANRVPQLDEARIAQSPPAQAVPAPPGPPPIREATPAASGSPEVASVGSRRGSSSESAALGLEAAQAQYMALVRAKISKTNERIMPRDWIRDVLRDKVSADFEVIIRNDGHILSTRLVRPTGYAVLDSSARQAIYTASPFEGFPQAAGNSLSFTVKVYFFTL